MIKSSGFSLLELLVTLSIATILLSVSMISYQHFFAKNRADLVINQLYHALNLARSEAIKRQTTITVCPMLNSYHCGSHWEKGYLLFIDYAHNGVIESHDKVLQVFKLPKSEGQLIWSGFPAVNYVQFAANGFIRAQNGSFYYCTAHDKVAENRTLIINKAGRMRIIKEANKCGVVN